MEYSVIIFIIPTLFDNDIKFKPTLDSAHKYMKRYLSPKSSLLMNYHN